MRTHGRLNACRARVIAATAVAIFVASAGRVSAQRAIDPFNSWHVGAGLSLAVGYDRGFLPGWGIVLTVETNATRRTVVGSDFRFLLGPDLWVVEYGPYVEQFGRQTGGVIPHARLGVSVLGADLCAQASVRGGLGAQRVGNIPRVDLDLMQPVRPGCGMHSLAVLSLSNGKRSW
jgi:hypothetical protein